MKKYSDIVAWEMSYPETSHKMASVTEPDQAWTIAELLERHRQGILTDTQVMRDGEILDDSTLDDPDLEKLRDSDIVDREEYLSEVHAAVDKVKAAKKEAADKKAAEEKKEFEEFKKSKTQKPFLKTDEGGGADPAASLRAKGAAPSEAGDAE